MITIKVDSGETEKMVWPSTTVDFCGSKLPGRVCPKNSVDHQKAEAF